MASVEFLVKRVDGKKAEVAKLEKKLERIEAAKATNWEKNPYYYSERDIKYTTRDLEEARAALADYEAKLKEAQDKAGSRNVKVILDFLENWKAKTFKFYHDKLPAYIEAKDAHDKEDSRLWDICWGRTEATEEERLKASKARRRNNIAFRQNWNWLELYVEYKWNGQKNVRMINDERLTRDLNKEANRKYDFIIERTCKIVGKITDVGFLYISDNGELNGKIIGTDATARVNTIGAGGYNIQCFHFRTLIHKM